MPAAPLTPKPSTLPPLEGVPAPPAHLSPEECDAWEEVGRRAVAAGTLSEADLSLLEVAALLTAAARRLAVDVRTGHAKATTLASLFRLQLDSLRQLGLTPVARGQVDPLTKTNKDPALDEFAGP